MKLGRFCFFKMLTAFFEFFSASDNTAHHDFIDNARPSLRARCSAMVVPVAPISKIALNSCGYGENLLFPGQYLPIAGSHYFLYAIFITHEQNVTHRPGSHIDGMLCKTTRGVWKRAMYSSSPGVHLDNHKFAEGKALTAHVFKLVCFGRVFAKNLAITNSILHSRCHESKANWLIC